MRIVALLAAGLTLGLAASLTILAPLSAAPETSATAGLPGRVVAPTDGSGGTFQVGGGSLQEQFTSPAVWSWLKDTIWYVSETGLPAYVLDVQRAQVRPANDQTVYSITDYQYGYFWGMTAAQISGAPMTCMTLVGSVTPEGQLLLTFTPVNATPVTAQLVTQGFGRMRFKLGQWTMENQMSTGPAVRSQVVHWAYMVRATPTQQEWNSLPGMGVSVPDFLGKCPPAPQVVSP